MPISEPKRGRKGFERSAPAVAANNKNAVLLVWLEHPANGSPDDTHLAWQIWLYDSRQFVDRGKFNGPITGTSPAVFARSDGGFTIVY